MASVSVKKKNFFKSVLPAQEVFLGTIEDTSLALPLEGKIRASQNHTTERGSRVQQQVQLTLARKGKRTSSSNGSLYPSRNQQFTDCFSAPGSASGLLYSKKCSSSSHVTGGSWGRERSSGRFVWRDGTGTRRTAARAEGPAQPNPLAPRPCLGGSLRYGTSYRGAHTLPIRSPSTARSSQLVQCRAQAASQSYARCQVVRSMRVGEAPKSPRAPLAADDAVFVPNNVVAVNAQPQQAALQSARGGQRPEGLSLLRHVRRETVVEQSARRISHPPARPPSGSPSLGSMELDLGRRAAVEAQQQHTAVQGNSVQGKAEGHVTELTLEKAVALLTQENTETQITAAQFVQHQSFSSADARKMVFYLHGVPKLIGLLKVDEEQLQAAAAGALRNVVFESNDNKMEVKDNEGIPVALQLLKTSRSIEIRKQLTGLLWNLSSNDILKEYLSKEAPETLTKSVLIPCSAIYEGENPKDDLLAHPDIFYNTTGCLRNMSSAGPEGRKVMRECETLIDSLVHYIRGTIADYIPDDKSTENCVCILHNLTYQMEAELPEKYTIKITDPQESPIARPKTPGCFGMRSSKVLERLEKEGPLLEEKSNPRGVEWLWCPITVRMYLSLMARSSRRYSKEAALGALQNVTAGNGKVSHAMACTIVKKEGGLQQVKKILQEDELVVKRTAVSLLRNISHYEELHSDIVHQVLPELVAMLPELDSSEETPVEVTVSLCNILLNLSQNQPQHARAILNTGGLKKIIAISAKDFGNMPSRESQAASLLLYALWRHTDLHGAYKKAGYKKPAFVNSRTTKAIHLLQS
ncbi:hypothetical protein COCON_G00114110 [Conger conger]|uniref:Plakophilin-2 n=1 Tax=Conger conger TaxID=82655 RepID=A0A9Q1DFR6_CONCO|nr:hypothetical protein COCON_G00114110 [Conger conger]